MSSIFIKLPTGDIHIEHIREMYAEFKDSKFKYMEFKPRPALIERNRGNTWLYTGQKFDAKYIDLVEDGWTHDHCLICSITISAGKAPNQVTEGYFDGNNWVCKSCYETVLSQENLEMKLAEMQSIRNKCGQHRLATTRGLR